MTFSKAKANLYPQSRGMALNTFITAVLCAACFFLPHIISDRGYFLFFGDFNVQQIPFYQLAHDAVRSGELGWSFTTDLGANFIGSYSFYLLGSPFFWLTIPFPNSFVPYLMGPLLILKFGCAALTAHLYISRFTKNALTAQLGAMLYAFSGFSVYNVFFNHFHEPLIVFPLLLLSFEYLITESRRGFFAIMVCVCALTNYFFFFGMIVFGLIYMIIRLISGAVRPRISLFLWIIFEALIGTALATFILIPSYLAISDSSRVTNITLGWNSILYGKESIYANIIEVFFFPPDIPARPVMFPKADVKWSSLGGWLPVFSMVGVFAYYLAKEGNWLKRIIATSAVMALVPILNSAFYAFNNAYYARWFYMPILMMCLATALAIEDSRICWKKGYKRVCIITAVIALVIGLFPQKESNKPDITIGLFTDPKNSMYLTRFLITVGIAVGGLVVLGFLLRMKRKNFEKFIQTAIICVAVFTIAYANFFIVCGKSHSYSDTEMIDNLIESNLVLEDDRDNYRIDVYSGIDNTAMFLGYSSINCFHSIVPSSVTKFYEFVGEDRGVASRPTTDSYPIRSLLSVKYLIQRENGDSFTDEDGYNEMYGYKHIGTDSGFKIYENENYIPYGFSYDTFVPLEQIKTYGDEDRAKMMLKAIVLSDRQIEKYGYMFESINEKYDDDSLLSFSDVAMSVDCEALKETAALYFETGKNSFRASVEREKETLVFFSIPYDKGWSAFVNGEKVEIEKVNIGFMAVPVKAGHSEIVFKYETPGLASGAIISVSALAILIIYLIAFRKTPENAEEYPEGDELFEVWALSPKETANEENLLEEYEIIEEIEE